MTGERCDAELIVSTFAHHRNTLHFFFFCLIVYGGEKMERRAMHCGTKTGQVWIRLDSVCLAAFCFTDSGHANRSRPCERNSFDVIAAKHNAKKDKSTLKGHYIRYLCNFIKNSQTFFMTWVNKLSS